MDKIEELTRRARACRRVLDERVGQARGVVARAQALETEVAALSDEVDVLDRVAVLLNSVGEERQTQAQVTIENLVTQGLQTIFDDSLTFHIKATTRAKTSGVEFVVRTTLGDEEVETPVLDARGGGLSATVGFLLRVVVMMLSAKEGKEDLLVLDETFAHVSAEYLEPVGQFLREIVDRSGIQILMVTHQPEFLDFADKAYKFSQDNGRTKVVAHG